MLASISVVDLNDGQVGGSDDDSGDEGRGQQRVKGGATTLRVPPAIPELYTDDGRTASTINDMTYDHSSASNDSSSSNEYSPFSEKQTVNPLLAPRTSPSARQPPPVQRQLKWLRAARCGPKGNTVLPVVLAATFTGSFTFGYNISVLNTALDTIAADLGWCSADGGLAGCDKARLLKSLLNVGLLIGAFIGALSATGLLKYGCRRVLTLNAAISLIAIYFAASAFSFSVLMGARVLLGFTVGVLSVVTPTLVAEVSPADRRGVYGTMHQLVITFAVTVGIALGFPFTPVPLGGTPDAAEWTVPQFDRAWWRVLLALSCVPVIGSLVVHGLLFNFDTPHYHLKQEDVKTAETVLKALRVNSTSDEIATELSEMRRNLKSTSKSISLLSAVRNRTYARIIFIGIIIALGQQLVGINAFITGSNTLFESVGLSADFVTGMSVLMAGLQFIFSVPALFLMDRYGRRPLLLVGIVGMCIAVAPGCVALWVAPDEDYTTWLAIGGSLGFIIAFALSYGPVCWVYLFEMFPLTIAAAGSSVATAANWAGAIVMSFIAIYVPTKINFLVFFVMQALWLILIAVFMKETKGRPLGSSPYVQTVAVLQPIKSVL